MNRAWHVWCFTSVRITRRINESSSGWERYGPAIRSCGLCAEGKRKGRGGLAERKGITSRSPATSASRSADAGRRNRAGNIETHAGAAMASGWSLVVAGIVGRIGKISTASREGAAAEAPAPEQSSFHSRWLARPGSYARFPVHTAERRKAIPPLRTRDTGDVLIETDHDIICGLHPGFSVTCSHAVDSGEEKCEPGPAAICQTRQLGLLLESFLCVAYPRGKPPNEIAYLLRIECGHSGKLWDAVSWHAR